MTTQDTIARMKKALAKGRMVYDTGRKHGKFPIYEQLSEDGRKLMGLTPLAEIIPNWKELPLKASLSLILGTEAHCISSGLPPGPRHLLEAALPIVLITVNAWLTVPAESPRLASPRMNRPAASRYHFSAN